MKTAEILLSLYRPNLLYLRELLCSLNAQTYPFLKLIVRNDDPEQLFPEDLLAECITAFPFEILQADAHVGYVKSFEQLTAAANSDYVCYCDQDDIWEQEKISLTMEALAQENAIFGCCDVSLIDKDGAVVVPSLRQADPLPCRTWHTGENITLKSLFSCYTPGLTIVAERKAAQACIPFSPALGHDHWLGSCLSAMGRGVNLNKPLVCWRRHNGNTTGSGVFQSIIGKLDYRKRWVMPTQQFIDDFSCKFPDYPGLAGAKAFNFARAKGDVFTILRYRAFSPKAAWGEVLIAILPDPLFKCFLRLQGESSHGAA